MKKKFNVFQLVIFLVLCVYMLSLILIFVWAVLNSFKDPDEFRWNAIDWPDPFLWSNYARAFGLFKVQAVQSGSVVNIGILNMYFNSVLYAVGSAFMGMIVPCITAYVTARFPFKFSKAVYGIVMITMVLPIVGSLPSQLQIVKALGWYDKIWGSVLMAGNFLGIYYMVFFATFKSMPNDYSEAAEIDGASYFRIMVQVYLPLVSKSMLTIFLLKFVQYWNDYANPLLFMPNRPTVAYGLFRFFSNSLTDASEVPLKIVAAMYVVLPIVIFFLCFQKKLLGNVSMGGIKG